MSSGALGRRNTLDKWGFLFCECKWWVIYCKLLSESESTLGKYFALGTLSLVWRSSCAAARLWDVRWFRAVVTCPFLRFCGHAWWCPEAVGTCLSCCTFKRARATLLELIFWEKNVTGTQPARALKEVWRHGAHLLWHPRTDWGQNFDTNQIANEDDQHNGGTTFFPNLLRNTLETNTGFWLLSTILPGIWMRNYM